MSTAVLTPPAAPAVTPPPAQPARPPRPAPPTTLRPFRWTIDQYRKLDATGVFRDMKTMLLNGEIYAMVMPSPSHDYSVGVTQDWLQSVFRVGHVVRAQMGFDIGTGNDPGPDLAVVTGSRKDYIPGTPTKAVLIVEVADSSVDTDKTTKAELYATAGVPDYWLLDLANRRLIVYRDPEPLPAGLAATAYRTRFTLGPTDTVSPLAAPAASVTVADLLP